MDLMEFVNKIVEKCQEKNNTIETFINSIELSCEACPLREKCQKADDEISCSDFLLRELSAK